MAIIEIPQAENTAEFEDASLAMLKVFEGRYETSGNTVSQFLNCFDTRWQII